MFYYLQTSHLTAETVDVVVSQEGNKNKAGQFTYVPGEKYTPEVSALSTTLGAVEGESLLIAFNYFELFCHFFTIHTFTIFCIV